MYDATDVPKSRADQRTDGGHEDHSRAIDFEQFLEKCVDYDCYGIGGSFGARRMPGLDVAKSSVDIQTALGLLDALSPVNV